MCIINVTLHYFIINMVMAIIEIEQLKTKNRMLPEDSNKTDKGIYIYTAIFAAYMYD